MQFTSDNPIIPRYTSSDDSVGSVDSVNSVNSVKKSSSPDPVKPEHPVKPESANIPTSFADPGNVFVGSTEPPKPRIVAKRFVKIANGIFNICYVQPIPLPAHLEWLQKLNTDGLNFIKIPIDDKQDMLYMRDSITRLVKQTNIQWDYTEQLINDYQNNESAANRQSLLNIINVAQDFCQRRNIEFLTQTLEE